MRVAEYDRFGPVDVLQVRDAAMPVAGPGEVLVAVAACSVNPKDVFLRKGRFAALGGETFPARPGFDFAGTVAGIGPGVAGFAEGDRVWGMVNGWRGGACAEYLVVPAGELGMAPDVPLDVAAAMPLAALTALQALRDTGEMHNDGARVLINGAAGGVGLFAVQIARALGAHVTAVASAPNAALCLDHGAHAFLARTEALPAATGIDLLLDAFGGLRFEDAAALLADDGVFVSTVPSPGIFTAQAATPGPAGRRARLVVVNGNRPDLDVLAAMVAAGQLRPHIDATYPLDAIQAAHAHVESKRTRGKVVVRMR